MRYVCLVLALLFIPTTMHALEKVPLILVPGFLASWNSSVFINPNSENVWEFTLGDDTYENLLNSFQDEGYVLGQDLFIAYYDWRQSNRYNYQTYLIPIIQEALAQNPHTDWVDIIAHSMGGIFTRAYIQGDDYDDDVRHFIMIATPNQGAADSYYLWSGGVFPPGVPIMERVYGNGLLFYRGLTHSPPIYSRRQLIQTEIKSAQELLPTYDFLVDFATGLDLPVLGMQVQNPLLPELNVLDGGNGLLTVADNVEQLTIIAGRGRDTIERIAVDTRTVGDRWYDGKPISGGIAYNQIGDGTVLGRSAFFPLGRPNLDCGSDEPPVLSWFIKTAHACDFIQYEYGIESIPGWDIIRQEYIYDAGHRDIVTKAIPIVHEVINQVDVPNTRYFHDDEDPEDVLGFFIASPLDPVIVDPTGRKFGKNINEIGPGAEYFDTNDPLGPKIIFIENPDEGTYDIQTTGTGDGEFDIGIMKLDTDNPDPIGSSDEVILPTIVGETNTGQEKVFQVESLGQGLVVDGVVYGQLPTQGAEITMQIRVNQLIEIIKGYELANAIQPGTSDILRRQLQSRIKQLNARDRYLERGNTLYPTIIRASVLQQLRSQIAYIEFMTSIRQISDSARDDLIARIGVLMEEV